MQLTSFIFALYKISTRPETFFPLTKQTMTITFYSHWSLWCWYYYTLSSQPSSATFICLDEKVKRWIHSFNITCVVITTIYSIVARVTFGPFTFDNDFVSTQSTLSFSLYHKMVTLFSLQVFGSPSAPILENPEHQTRWYFKYFLGKCKCYSPYMVANVCKMWPLTALYINIPMYYYKQCIRITLE